MSVGRDDGAPFGEAAVGSVLFVLEASLLIRPGFFPFPALLEAYYDSYCDQNQERHKRGDRRYHNHVLCGEVGLGRHSRTGGCVRGCLFANAARVLGGAVAFEAVHQIDARATVQAGAGLAFVYLQTAVFTRETWRALAFVIVR